MVTLPTIATEMTVVDIDVNVEKNVVKLIKVEVEVELVVKYVVVDTSLMVELCPRNDIAASNNTERVPRIGRMSNWNTLWPMTQETEKTFYQMTFDNTSIYQTVCRAITYQT